MVEVVDDYLPSYPCTLIVPDLIDVRYVKVCIEQKVKSYLVIYVW